MKRVKVVPGGKGEPAAPGSMRYASDVSMATLETLIADTPEQFDIGAALLVLVWRAEGQIHAMPSLMNTIPAALPTLVRVLRATADAIEKGDGVDVIELPTEKDSN